MDQGLARAIAHEETVDLPAGETGLGQGGARCHGHHGELAVVRDLAQRRLGDSGDVDGAVSQG
jgi:hypothetical protein